MQRRGYAIVCLSPRLTATRAILHTPRRATPDTDKLRSMLAELESVIEATDAQTIVVDVGRSDDHSATLLDGVVPWTETRGLRVVRWNSRHACSEVCGSPTLLDAVRRIVSRYRALREGLIGPGGELRSNYEHWRHLRPLLIAFVLAHGFAARSVITTFGSIPPHPHSPYDTHP